MALWQKRRAPGTRKASSPTEVRSDGVFYLLASSVFLALSTLILGMPGDYWPMLLPAFVLSVMGWLKAKIRPLRIVSVFVTGVSGGMLFGDLAAWFV